MKKRIAKVAACALVVSVMLGACGGSGGGGNSSSTTAASTATAASTEAGAEDSAEAEQPAEVSADYEYPVMTWRVANAVQDGSPSDLGCKAFAEYITEKSGGNITVEVYPAGQLGTDIAQVEACQLGDLEFTSGSTFALQQVSAVDGVLMWDLPYFFTPFTVLEIDDLKLTQDDPSYKAIFVDQLKEKNIHYINQAAHGNYVIGGKKAFKTVDDFKSVKLRAAENAMLVEALEEWGAQPVVINMFELFTAIEQGTCDAAYVPDALFYQFSLQDACDYVTFFDGGLGPCYLSCAEDFFQSQEPEVQALIMEAGQKYCDAGYGSYDEQLHTWLEAFDAAGCEVVWLTDEEKAALREGISGTHEHWRELCGEEIYDASQEYIRSVLGN